MPASTSPVPAVASQGGALALIAARPSGAAMTVSGPLSSDDAFARLRGFARGIQSCRPLREQARKEPLELAFMRREHATRTRS